MKMKFLKTLVLVLSGFGLASGAQAKVDASKVQPLSRARSLYIDVHPLLIPGGSVSADLTTDVTDYWTAGLSVGHGEASLSEEGYRGSSVGLIGTYFLNTPLLNSPYIKGHVGGSWTSATVRDENTNTLEKGIVNTGDVSLLTGYHWTWLNGITANVGVGGAYRVIDSTAKQGIVVKKGVLGRALKANFPHKNFRGVTPTAEVSVGIRL